MSGVRTIYELAVILRVDGKGDFTERPRRFDELERNQAIEAYGREVSRGKATVGKPQLLATNGGGEITETVSSVLVELWQFKLGDGWIGSRKVVDSDEEKRNDGLRSYITKDSIAVSS